MVLPSKLRLRGYRCFDYIYKKGNTFHSSSMVLRVVLSKARLLKDKNHKRIDSPLRLAISISHKVSKKAVTRNKIRRIMHEHFRISIHKLVANQKNWALVSLKPSSSDKSFEFLLKEFDRLLFKAGLLR